MKDILLFAEGFIGAAGSMVSETAIGAVDLTQIIGIASIDGVNRLTGGQTPEWMKRDLQGTADNLSSLAELGVGTYTALTDPGAAMRGQDPNASYADKAAYRAQQTGKALWDKVTHMDAYDAGGLTFEIASLFVGPAAVGKMAKGTKLGAKAAEMIQLAKNSTKARILANVEKWGSKADNILSKSNNVIRQFGEKLLDTRIPVSIRQEAFAFAGGMGTMPTFSVESKTLREVMHFSSKHAEDVARGVGGSGKATATFKGELTAENITKELLQTKPKNSPITSPANIHTGQIIDRFGPSGGTYVSPVEDGKIIAFNKRGLPYPEGYQDYHQYEVVKDINLKNLEEGFLSMSDVDQEKLSIIMQKRGISFSDLATPAKGEIAKAFGAGGGTQIKLGTSVSWYEKMGLLKEIK